MANASTPSVVQMHQTHLKYRVTSLLDDNSKTQRHSLAVGATLEFTTAQPTDTVISTVLLSNDAMGTKAGSPSSLVPTVWQVCSTGSLTTRPGLGVRGRGSREETGNTVFLVMPPGLAPGVIVPSTVSMPPKEQKGKKRKKLTAPPSLSPSTPRTQFFRV